MYKIYKNLSFLIYPFIKILLLLRVLKGKESKKRYKEKLGFASIKRPDGKLVWFHAASIGEFNAILPIIKEVEILYPNLNILVTTVTLTAASIASSNLPERVMMQFMPLDCINIVKRFLFYWRPNLVIWTESELWPNIIYEASKKAKLLLINARISKKSFKRWSLLPESAKSILGKFSLILAQSIETKAYLKSLGVRDVLFLGNLKFNAANFSYDKNELEQISPQIKDRVVIIAASTHPKEEEIFAQVHLNLKTSHPELLTIIAPRHVTRVDSIEKTLRNLNFVTRSSKEPITKDTDILLVDTIGEFGLLLRLSKITCIGGSWSRIAHSFLEAAKLNNLIIIGPNTQNSKEIADHFIENKAALFAKDEKEIEEIIRSYLKNPKSFDSYLNKSSEIVEKMSQIKEEILLKTLPYLNNL